jgi:predicted nucleic-acid-binding protein
MKAVIDPHVLKRFLVQSPNDTQQNELAAQVFIDAEEIIIPTHVLCELVWVVRSLYALCNEKIAALIEHLLCGDEKLNLREDEVEAGLRMLLSGGDFADGVNAYAWRLMTHGESIFVCLIKKAVKLLLAQGLNARLL